MFRYNFLINKVVKIDNKNRLDREILPKNLIGLYEVMDWEACDGADSICGRYTLIRLRPARFAA